MFRSVEHFEKALKTTARNYPDSLLADLLVHFEVNIVAKLIQIYPGQHLRIPNKSEIWRNYRDKIIRETLDVEDSKAIRIKLAKFFSISLSHVSTIFYKQKRDYPKECPMDVTAAARSVYEKELDTIYKEMTKLFLDGL